MLLLLQHPIFNVADGDTNKNKGHVVCTFFQESVSKFATQSWGLKGEACVYN